MALAEILVVVICSLVFAVFVAGICRLMLLGNGPQGRDLVSYWAAGQQLVHHQNPYDSDAIQRIESAVGFPANSLVLIMRNPPSAVLLALPLGFVGLRAAALLWSLLLLSCLIVSVRMLWVMYGSPKNRLDLLGYSFGPALICLNGGQTALFSLLGVVLFLRFHRSHQFLAGVTLWLCALKPHLFLPFAAVLLVWIVFTRSYPVLVGAILALGASSMVAFVLDPSVWAQYAQMMRNTGIESEFIPCLSIVLRLGLSPHAMRLQYVPAAVGCVWAIHYYWSRRDAWDWMEHGPLLLLFSIFVSPYAWLTDQVLAMPAVLQAAYRTNSRNVIGAVALISCVIEIQALCGTTMHSILIFWTAPAWLVWYFFAVRYVDAQPKFTSPSAAPALLPADLPSPPSPRLTLPG